MYKYKTPQFYYISTCYVVHFSAAAPNMNGFFTVTYIGKSIIRLKFRRCRGLKPLS